MEKLLHIANEKETEKLGEAIGRAAVPGMVIALIGDLGTGKTTLTKSIARGLGVTETVTSPTFNIIREYRSGRMPLYHFDVYRIGDPDEMFELGYEEYFYGDGVCVVEWADIIEELLPEDAVIIHIDRGDSEEEREYRIEGGLFEAADEDLCTF
ncbi:MAG: tRNA (adenosine(37)-N6)-threonylcarbamoyltransferase complex ATPase subunit type 1 TsaE [Bacillota bacterium]